MKTKLTLLLFLALFSFSAQGQWAIDNFTTYLENGQYEEYINKANESTDTLKGKVKRNVREAIQLFQMMSDKSTTPMSVEQFDNIVKMLNIPIEYQKLEEGLQLGKITMGQRYYYFLHNTSETHNRIVNLEGKFRTEKGIEYNTIRAGVPNNSVKQVAITDFPFEYEVVNYKMK